LHAALCTRRSARCTLHPALCIRHCALSRGEGEAALECLGCARSRVEAEGTSARVQCQGVTSEPHGDAQTGWGGWTGMRERVVAAPQAQLSQKTRGVASRVLCFASRVLLCVLRAARCGQSAQCCLVLRAACVLHAECSLQSEACRALHAQSRTFPVAITSRYSLWGSSRRAARALYPMTPCAVRRMFCLTETSRSELLLKHRGVN
jgi:hypothetical protein